jgi:hypothetical protein
MNQENLFSIQTRCFKFGGFEKWSKVLNMVQLYLIVELIYFSFSELLFIVKNHRDVLASAEAFGPFATAFLGIVKIVTFYVSLDKFHAFIERIKCLNKTGLSGNKVLF